ncbi:HAD-IA family hydrolase [Aliiroseovarius sp. YM-037]|uniref:HAD-IA family hydrolase n=1 Tax=Aliiroseovarius sp. YM-037 TaxID=3341728 RepID=UPI003A8113F8
MRTVVFDLDGTLADTGADLIAAANACFQGLGHGDVLDPVTDRSTAFQGGRAMLKLGFERLNGAAQTGDIDTQYPILLEAYAGAIDTHTTLYPGMVSAIEQLLEDGYRTAICTNKPERLAELLMTRLGVRGLFGSLVGADTLPVRKPDPAPYFEAVTRARGVAEQSLLVGDTVTDRETARAAGVASVLVTFGPDGDAVSALEPEALLAHYDDLPEVVARLIG